MSKSEDSNPCNTWLATYAIETIADEDLSRSLLVLLGEPDDVRVPEALATNKRCPRFEHDTLRLAILDELVTSHEGVQVLVIYRLS